MRRPAVDVVVPFAGSDAALEALLALLARLPLGPDDTVAVADNRPPPAGGSGDRGPIRVLAAGERAGSYHARNVAARAGANPWLVFIDADVEPDPDLLDGYFSPSPPDATAVLAGAVLDRPGPRPAERYAHLRAAMSQEHSLRHGFGQTANLAVRRSAFTAVGGFEDGVRSGGDADLCLRLRAAGWGLEERPGARVTHRNRTSIPALLRQRARHGSGAAWLERRHPGSFPPRRPVGLAWWSARRAGSGLLALARGDRDGALTGLLDGPAVWAFELGRLVPNRPAQRGR